MVGNLDLTIKKLVCWHWSKNFEQYPYQAEKKNPKYIHNLLFRNLQNQNSYAIIYLLELPDYN